MSDTKAIIIFIACSTILLTGIGLLPESRSLLVHETAVETTTNPAIVHVIQTSDLAPVKDAAAAGWEVIVQEY